jgi:hypothetical protein
MVIGTKGIVLFMGLGEGFVVRRIEILVLGVSFTFEEISFVHGEERDKNY